MIALAIVLLVIVAAIVLFVVVTGASQTVRLEWDQLNIAWELSVLLIFLLGALALLLVGIALGAFRRGTKKGIQRRRELKRLREADAERTRTQRTHAEQDRVAHAKAVPPPDDRPTTPDGPRASGATRQDSSWYDDNPPDRR